MGTILFEFAKDVDSTVHEIELDKEKEKLLEQRRTKMKRHTSMINVPLSANQKSEMLRYLFQGKPLLCENDFFRKIFFFRKVGSKPEEPGSDTVRPRLMQSKSEIHENSFDSFQDNFQDLESVLTSFQIDDNKKSKYKRRRSLACSMKFWKSKDGSKA